MTTDFRGDTYTVSMTLGNPDIISGSGKTFFLFFKSYFIHLLIGLSNLAEFTTLLFIDLGVLVTHYLQSITPSLALGGELAYQRGPGVPGGHIAVLSAAGRYTNGESTISGSLGRFFFWDAELAVRSVNFSVLSGLAGCHLCFHQKASQQLQVGVELEVNSRIQESTATIAYQIDLPKADLVFRGEITRLLSMLKSAEPVINFII